MVKKKGPKTQLGMIRNELTGDGRKRQGTAINEELFAKEKKMLSYDAVLRRAWENLLKNYEENKINFDNESTLQSHLFAECLRIMIEESFETPYKIYTERKLLTEGIPNELLSDPKGRKADLVLGDNEIAVELKIATSGLPPSPSDVKKDLDKLSRHTNFAKIAYFLALDLRHWGPLYHSSIESGLREAEITTAGEERHTRDDRKYMAFIVRKTEG